MSVELNSSLALRARTHAALADPGRLHIVDVLALGDRSSGELQEETGMASNLLAHHLRVLDEAGVIDRHRSEGDRRRSYVSLRRGALESLVVGSGATARRVVFVCTANSARSQLAAALWKTVSSIPSVSAGTHPAERIADGAFDVARAHDLDLPDVAPRQLDRVSDGDYVITVCDSAREELGAAASAHWSVPDPVAADSRAAFELAFDDLRRRVRELAPRLSPA